MFNLLLNKNNGFKLYKVLSCNLQNIKIYPIRNILVKNNIKSYFQHRFSSNYYVQRKHFCPVDLHLSKSSPVVVHQLYPNWLFSPKRSIPININQCHHRRKQNNYWDHLYLNCLSWFKGYNILTLILLFPIISLLNNTKAYCCQEENEELEITNVPRKLQLREDNDLSHKQQIKRATGAAVDAAYVLLSRYVSTFLDTAQIYEHQLVETCELFELCIKVINKEDQHNIVWDAILDRRGELNINKQLLQDLELGLEYAHRLLDTAAFASCLVEDEYSIQAANQMIILSQEHIKLKKLQLKDLETQYVNLQAQHVTATAKLADKEEKEAETEETSTTENTEDIVNVNESDENK